MDRQINYPGQIAVETDLLNTNRNTMIALGKLAGAMFGTGGGVNGLVVVPSSPAALTVSVGIGEIYQLQNVDNTAFSSLPADTTDAIVKQGIMLAAQTLACAAPVTAGYSINYLIQATYQDSDTGSVALPYYNASNPSQAYSGPANSGTPQATRRAGIVVPNAKAGTAATTGAQVTPTADSGYIALAVVTVANGQTTITAASISQVSASYPQTLAMADLASSAAGKGVSLVYDASSASALANNTVAGKGAALTGFYDAIAPTYLKTLSDIANGSEVSLLRFISPTNYAAIRAGTLGYDATSNFAAAFSAFTTKGFGSLFIPYGGYLVSAESVMAFNGRIRGEGVGATVISTNSLTAHIFRLAYSGLLDISGIDFQTSVVKTSGAAIRVEGAGGGASIQTRIHHNRMQAMFYGLDMGNAGYWTVSENFIGESINAGIRVDNTQHYDAGDNLILGNVIQKTATTAGTSGILHVGSGGTKVIGNKVLGHDRGYALLPRVGATSMIDTQIVGNSFENGNNGIYLATPNASTSIGQVVISGNQISEAVAGINITGAVSGVAISGNQISVNAASGIAGYFDTASGTPSQIVVTGNQVTGNSSTGSIGLYSGASLTGMSASGNGLSGVVTQYSGPWLLNGAAYTFATLPTPANGSVVFCSDGTIANPVAGGGTGCIAKRLNGVWVGN